jgi:hypothetical protein
MDLSIVTVGKKIPATRAGILIVMARFKLLAIADLSFPGKGATQ